MADDLCSILLATDFSSSCDRALNRAFLLAHQRRCRLVVLHVIGPGAAGASRGSERGDADAELVERRLHALVGGAGVPVEPVLARGDPAAEIQRVARARQCDLVVVGAAREEGPERPPPGATAQRLARESDLPVLMVRAHPRQPYAHIVAATDFSEGSRQSMNVARALFPRAGMTMVHAYAARDPACAGEYPARAQAECDANGFVINNFAVAGRAGTRLVLEPGPAEQAVPDYARQQQADLLAVGTHGRTGMSGVALGSVAERLIRLAPCDVLVVRESVCARQRLAG